MAFRHPPRSIGDCRRGPQPCRKKRKSVDGWTPSARFGRNWAPTCPERWSLPMARPGRGPFCARRRSPSARTGRHHRYCAHAGWPAPVFRTWNRTDCPPWSPRWPWRRNSRRAAPTAVLRSPNFIVVVSRASAGPAQAAVRFLTLSSPARPGPPIGGGKTPVAVPKGRFRRRTGCVAPAQAIR